MISNVFRHFIDTQQYYESIWRAHICGRLCMSPWRINNLHILTNKSHVN